MTKNTDKLIDYAILGVGAYLAWQYVVKPTLEGKKDQGFVTNAGTAVFGEQGLATLGQTGAAILTLPTNAVNAATQAVGNVVNAATQAVGNVVNAATQAVGTAGTTATNAIIGGAGSIVGFGMPVEKGIIVSIDKAISIPVLTAANTINRAAASIAVQTPVIKSNQNNLVAVTIPSSSQPAGVAIFADPTASTGYRNAFGNAVISPYSVSVTNYSFLK